MTDWHTETDGPVTVLTMSSGENMLSPTTLGAWNDVLDSLEALRAPHALIVTGQDKYWSTGLDLDTVAEMSTTERRRFLDDLDALLLRLVTAPYVTVAALNGHTYAGGALLSLACDYRVMRIDRGYFCLPSVDVEIPFSPGMAALITAKIPQPVAHDLVISCRAIGAGEALASGVVNYAVAADNVMPLSRELAYAHADKDPTTLGVVKRRMYAHVVTAFTEGA